MQGGTHIMYTCNVICSHTPQVLAAAMLASHLVVEPTHEGSAVLPHKSQAVVYLKHQLTFSWLHSTCTLSLLSQRAMRRYILYRGPIIYWEGAGTKHGRWQVGSGELTNTSGRGSGGRLAILSYLGRVQLGKGKLATHHTQACWTATCNYEFSPTSRWGLNEFVQYERILRALTH